MNIFIPIIASALYWLGGSDQMQVPFNQKLFRWVGVGCWLAICSLFNGMGLWSFLLPLTYFVATNVMGYGENHPLRKWFGKDIQWIIYGFSFGLASCFALCWLSLFQMIISIIATYVLLKWSNDGFDKLPYIGTLFPCLLGNKLNHNFVEIGIGLFGTILYVFIR